MADDDLPYMVATFTFIGTWIYCIATYGFLFGVGLGWLPALICAGFAAIIIPPLLVIAAYVAAGAALLALAWGIWEILKEALAH